MIRHDELARAFVELADTLVDDFDVTDFLHRLTDITVEVLDADAAGLVLSDERGTLTAGAVTGPAEALEALELRIGEGPCLDCFTAGSPVVNVPAEESARRWPRFHVAALAAGFDAVHALPMRLRTRVIGGVNIYFVAPRTLEEVDLAVAQALADVATIALLQERTVGDRTLLTEQLQGALTTRVLIEQAKGVLAERLGVSVGEGFALLRDTARRERVPLRVLAEGVVDGRVDTAAWQQAPG